MSLAATSQQLDSFMNMTNNIKPPRPGMAEEEIAALARKVGRDWASPPASRPGSSGSVIQRMPHGRFRSVSVEIKRSRRPAMPG